MYRPRRTRCRGAGQGEGDPRRQGEGSKDKNRPSAPGLTVGDLELVAGGIIVLAEIPRRRHRPASAGLLGIGGYAVASRD